LDYKTEELYVENCMLLCNSCENDYLMGICVLSIRNRVFSSKLANGTSYLWRDFS